MSLSSLSSHHRIIIHCDIDAFFPSCEVSRNPLLKNRPLIVGADPRIGRGRGVVSSCSYEARKIGVHPAMPISKAYHLCPQGVYLTPDIKFYNEISRRIMDLLGSFSNKFEQASIDEAYLDVSGSCVTLNDARELALKMKTALRTQESMTMTVGVAPNKSIAKIASSVSKPDGLTVVSADEARRYLAPLPVERINGVGVKTKEVLHKMNIETVGQLRQQSVDKLNEWFGRTGTWLWTVSNGLENAPVKSKILQKSISLEQTFKRDILSKVLVGKAFEKLGEQIHGRLVSEGLTFRTVGIRIRFANFDTYTRGKTLGTQTDDYAVVSRSIKAMLNDFARARQKVRLVGVRLSYLRRTKGKQEKLDRS